MRGLSLCVLLIAVLPGPAADDKDSIPLFNGKDLEGWVAEGDKEYKVGDDKKPVWTVNGDGFIECAGKGYGFLRYDKKEFGDFAFHTEYRMAKNGNSGIGIRTVPYDHAKGATTRPSSAAYEVQLLDDAGKQPNKNSSGSLYNHVAPKEITVKASPEWNALDIECVGPRIKITINGKEVLDVDQSTVEAIKNKPLKGYVCLQNHHSKIEFRNVRLKEIKAPADK